jgi:hypothetical protein
MRTSGTLLVCLVLATWSVAWAQPPDYKAMRFGFAAQPDYKAYLVPVIEYALIQQATSAWQKGDTVTTIAKLEEVIKVYPVSIEAHRRLADVYKLLVDVATGEDDKKTLEQAAVTYRQMADGLVKSIVDSGDGKSAATAYQVISIPEEYMALWYLGLTREQVELGKLDDRFFDVFTVVDKDGRRQTVYFDVTLLVKTGAPKAP